MGVYLPIKDYSAMQGPAPSGFHVPSKDEWVALCGILTTTFSMASNATTMGTYLKMHMAGNRNHSTSSVNSAGSRGYYRSATFSNANYAYYLHFISSGLYPQYEGYRSYGFSVRCFKDTPIVPTSSWTTLYDGSSVATGAGVFWNSADGLISVSGDGTTWYTIQDKNLGATTVFNQGDTETDANCGYFYQWGNNYGFAHSGTVTTSSTQVDASSYGPGNYYSSSTFITRSSSPYDWSSVQNDNLWGGVTGVKIMSELKNAYIGIPNPTSIVLNKRFISLTTIGQTEQLTATIEPTISDHSITWSSDDTTVATVSTTGLVTCVTPGTCTITATTVNGLTASCGVTNNQGWQPGVNTIAYYPLNSTTTVNDMSGNGNHGTMNGTITFGSALGGVDCGSFPGSSSTYINVPNSSDFATTTITYSFWIASSQRTGNRGIIYKGPFTGVPGTYYITNYQNFGVSINGVETYTTMFDSNNQWVYAVVSYDGSTMKIYKNGVLDTSASTSYDISLDTNPLKIGAYWNSSYCFYGYMSELIIENKVWTAQEVAANYNRTKANYGL